MVAPACWAPLLGVRWWSKTPSLEASASSPYQPTYHQDSPWGFILCFLYSAQPFGSSAGSSSFPTSVLASELLPLIWCLEGCGRRFHVCSFLHKMKFIHLALIFWLELKKCTLSERSWIHLLFFFFGHTMQYVELPQPGIELAPLVVEAQCLNH